MSARTILRQSLMACIPLAGAILTLFHPKQPLAALFEDAALRQRWLTVHVLQLFMFTLLAVVVILLLQGRQGGAATIARAAMFGFAVFYGAYDGLAGIATGVLAANAATLPAPGQAGALQAAQGLFFAMEEGSFAWIGLLGTFFWVVGLFAAGIDLARPSRASLALGLALFAALLSTFGTQAWHPLHLVSAAVGGLALLTAVLSARGPWLPMVFLSASGLALTSGHPAPMGTIAFGALFLGVCAWELAAARQASPVLRSA